MFNEEIKLRFIDSINVDQYTDGYWDNLFNKTESLETEYNKDLCNFTKNEILVLYKIFDSKSYDFLMVTNYNIIKYVQWALQESLIIDGMNHFAEIGQEELYGCVNKFGIDESIITKEKLNEILAKINAFRDKYAIIALFEGIKGTGFSDVINANIRDIDKQNKKMKLYSGKTIDVSDRFIMIAELAANEDTYVSPGGRTYHLIGEDGAIYKIFDKKIIEGNESKNLAKVYRRVLNALDESRFITPNSIFTSGLIYRINQFAEEDGVTAAEVLRDQEHVDYLINQFGFNKKITARFLFKYKNYLK